MFDFWKDDLSDEKRDELLDKCSKEIRSRKLEAPAILFLEMNKPLCNVYAHLGVASAPFLVPLFGFDFVNEYSSLFRNRDNVEALIQMIESPEEEPREEKLAMEPESEK
jgi:hypothetical protein